MSDQDLTPSSVYRVPPTIVRETLSEDELVVLDSESHRFYSLNSTAKRVYELAAEGLALGAIAEQLGREYDVPVDDCAADTMAFLGDLVSQGLLVAVPERV